MMLLWHGWGCRTPLIALLTFQRLLLTFVLDICIKFLSLFNDVCGYMSASLLCYTINAWSDFGNFWSLVNGNDTMMSWSKLKTPFDCFSYPYLSGIQCVLAPFNDVCGYMSASLLCYTNKAWSDFGNSWSLVNGNDAMMSWLRLKTSFDCFSHSYWTYIKCVWTMSASLLCYTNEGRSDFDGNSGSLWLSGNGSVMSWLRL